LKFLSFCLRLNILQIDTIDIKSLFKYRQISLQIEVIFNLNQTLQSHHLKFYSFSLQIWSTQRISSISLKFQFIVILSPRKLSKNLNSSWSFWKFFLALYVLSSSFLKTLFFHFYILISYWWNSRLQYEFKKLKIYKKENWKEFIILLF
jgi:hypothetical protein